MERGVGTHARPEGPAARVPTLVRQDKRLQLLHRLQENRRQLRVVHRQEAIATLHDQLRIDRLNLLRNDSNLAATLGLINPVVVDTADQIDLVQRTIQVHNVLLEARVRGAVERIRHHHRIGVRRIQRGKARDRIVKDAELVHVATERIFGVVGVRAKGEHAHRSRESRTRSSRHRDAIQIQSHRSRRLVGDHKAVPRVQGDSRDTGHRGDTVKGDNHTVVLGIHRVEVAQRKRGGRG